MEKKTAENTSPVLEEALEKKQEPDKKEKENKNLPIYSLDNNLVALLKKSEVTTATSLSVELEQYLANKETAVNPLNIAEKYLIEIIKAKIAIKNKQSELAITILTAANKMAENINDKQLNTPLFYQLDNLLALSFADVGDFKQAFDYKKSFFKKYNKHYRMLKQHTVSELNEKYQMDMKENQNKLLAEQNTLAAAEIAQSKNDIATKKRNSIILFIISLIFAGLIYRQLVIRFKLKRINSTDTLTGLLNRRVLFERGEKFIAQVVASQYKRKLCVCLFDIDHFKNVNDTYGHHAGDEVLKIIANIAKETMRSRDVLARLGGEEFVAILPDASLEEANAIAERLREKIAEYDFSSTSINTPITASFGVSCINNHFSDFDSFLNSADKAMYHAKTNGRNKVVCYASILNNK
jgi:diguanylate cyclase (GGDEF)-like protein